MISRPTMELSNKSTSVSCHGGSSVGMSMEVGRWSSRPSLMTPKPARKGRDRSWFLQLVPNQVQLSRWRSKSAAPQEIISRSSRTSRRRRLCDGLRDDELAVVPSLSRHVADHGLRVGAPSFSDFDRGWKSRPGGSDVAMAAETEEDLLLRSFMAEVSGVERDNEVARDLANGRGTAYLTLGNLMEDMRTSWILRI
ncbi:hypothetical protein B296_00011503 [Ensete ventricosum]|uniref:Uncharacterized protein n=1 Tax=Ensete ventricosum TaxID=4639 RepID=A0A427A2G9_ENSVE|nr:hypothetical protein B296_00011503 [Ensete ventricosum]